MRVNYILKINMLDNTQSHLRNQSVPVTKTQEALYPNCYYLIRKYMSREGLLIQSVIKREA